MASQIPQPFELERQRWSQEGVPDVDQRLDADEQ